MKIGLVSYEFRNHDITFNLSQIEKAMRSSQGKVDLLCFGEAFLQGFDALCWNYNNDKHIAVAQNSASICQLCDRTIQYGIDLMIGYLETYHGCIYSSYAVIEKGNIIYNYRRISKGWKETITDEHYREGQDVQEFVYRGKRFKIALCGDMWDFPEQFQTEHVFIWPIYVNFRLAEWTKYEEEYAKQAHVAATQTLMINSLSGNPKSHGGAFYFVDGKTAGRTNFDKEEILIVEI